MTTEESPDAEQDRFSRDEDRRKTKHDDVSPKQAEDHEDGPTEQGVDLDPKRRID